MLMTIITILMIAAFLGTIAYAIYFVCFRDDDDDFGSGSGLVASSAAALAVGASLLASRQ